MALAVTAGGAALLKPDLSGEWVFNAEKSKLQIKVKIESGIFTIDHREPDFRLWVADRKN